MSSNSRHHYSRVLDHDEENPQETKILSKGRTYNLILIAMCFFVGITGFFVAQAGSNIATKATSGLERKPVLSLVSTE